MDNVELARVIKRYDQTFEDLIKCANQILSEVKDFSISDYKELSDTMKSRGQIIMYPEISLYKRKLSDLEIVLNSINYHLDE